MGEQRYEERGHFLALQYSVQGEASGISRKSLPATLLIAKKANPHSNAGIDIPSRKRLKHELKHENEKGRREILKQFVDQ